MQCMNKGINGEKNFFKYPNDEMNILKEVSIIYNLKVLVFKTNHRI